MSFVPLAIDCASLLFEAVLSFCSWNFVSSLNQVGAFNCTCIALFVTVLLVPTDPEHRDHRTVCYYKLGNNNDDDDNNNNKFIPY